MLKSKSTSSIINDFLKAIDKNKVNKAKHLLNEIILSNENDNKDIVLELYNCNKLNEIRLRSIIDNFSDDLKISSSLINKLIKDNDAPSLSLIFKKYNLYDNKFVFDLLLHYKNQIQITSSQLKQKMSNYKISRCYENYCNCLISGGISSILNGACKTGNVYLVKYLIKNGIDINVCNSKNWTVLHHACKNGQENIVKYLIENGANINKKNDQLDSPLHIAINNGKVNVAIYLIEHGANVNEYDSNKHSPLYKAIKFKQEEIAKYLFKYDAKLNSYFTIDDIFDMAFEKRLENFVKFIITRGFNINKKDGKGNLLIHKACKFITGNENLVKYLIELGTNINERNNDADTPLHLACKGGGDVNIINYIVEQGAKIDLMNKYLCTPLHMACKNDNINVAVYLIEHGANINKANADGKTPLACMTYADDRFQIIMDLSKKGIDI